MVGLTLLLGAVVGLLAGLATRADPLGLAASVVFGMIGAIIGHGSADALGAVRDGSLNGWRLAFLGAVSVPLLMQGLGLFRLAEVAPQRARRP